jgi:hypothetical protein
MAAMGRKVAARNQARNVAEALRRTLGQENGLTKRADAHVAQLTARRRSR